MKNFSICAKYSVLRALFILLAIFFVHAAQSQIVYSIGSPTATGAPLPTLNNIYIIDPATGLATLPSVPNTIGPLTSSAAIGVSPLDGRVYVIERLASTPRIVAWDPATGVSTLIGNAGTPAAETSILRATFCPDGKFYVAGNGAGGGAGAEIYQLNPSNGALIRTVVLTNLPTVGSGDLACTSNGDLYAIAQAAGPGSYQMYLFSQASLNASTGSVTITGTLQGNSNIANTQGFNGLAELPNGNLIASVLNAQTAMYLISTSTFAATTLTTTDFAAHADLGRGFPLGLSISKTMSPTSVVQGTQTITYSIVVNNAGPAVVGSTTITDIISSNFSTPTWVCATSNTGRTNTAVTTGCGLASGTGDINNTVSLSIGGQVRFTITATLRSTVTGTLSNSASGAVNSNLTLVTPSATVSTVTATIQAAASLSVAKTNGTTTVVAGSTTNYTLTFTNGGPGPANNAVIQDIPSAGLRNCSAVSCSGAGSPTPATCPVTPTLMISPGTTTIPSFPANSSVTIVVSCGVSATGF